MDFFKILNELPPDPLFGIQKAFEEDPSKSKVNLSVGTYKTDELQPYILPSVKDAEKELILSERSKDYLPIEGLHAYIEATKELIFEKRSGLFGAQTVGGTSALRLAAEFLKKAGMKRLYLSDPTWGNHPHIFKEAGLQVERYPYFEGVAPFETMAEESIVLLQPCCHNPTGCDYTEEQKEELLQIIAKRRLFPLFDMAYQGFGESVDADASFVRASVDRGIPFMLAVSHSKNFGLYRERTGALFVKHGDEKRLMTQLRMSIRGLYSNPPSHGAQIVAHILKNDKARWLKEVEEMRQRISAMRAQIATGPFAFMAEQRGMFSYTRLSKEQVVRLRDEFGIYMTLDGRINVAGLNSKNVGYVSQALLKVNA